ncbi:MAG: hypothetical protein P4L53_09265 [Candidatus Obscuribacterales bacterium]|nr:hypothetical protein [Candidatus Obscuribacterales bacterium]
MINQINQIPLPVWAVLIAIGLLLLSRPTGRFSSGYRPRRIMLSASSAMTWEAPKR